MMMPANFSAVAENEMTYVVGGTLVDVLAPAMTVGNWQNVVTNLITMTGNTVLGSDGVKGAYAHLFSGAYVPGDLTKKAFDAVTGAYDSGKTAGNTSDWALAKGLLNSGLVVVQALAAVYTLGTDTVKINVKAFA